MTRSGYTDDCDGWSLICWRGAVASAIRGKRGQLFLMEMLASLDALPLKRLAACSQWGLFEAESVCAIGAVGKRRALDMSTIDPEDPPQVARAFGIAQAMAQEIVYVNDEWYRLETPEARFTRVREWIVSQIEGLTP